MKTILQSEASECGLACLAMVADHFGFRTDLSELRRRFLVGMNGVNLKQLMGYAGELELACQPLRLELDEVGALARPCILHWDLNHFVVLKDVKEQWGGQLRVVIVDPAVGERVVGLPELSERFTGVALELSPTERFEKKVEAPKVGLGQLTGNVIGLRSAIVQVMLLALVLEIMAIVAPLFNQFVIDNVIVSGDTELLGVLLYAFSLLLVTQTAIGVARRWFLMRWSVDISLQWSTRVLSHLFRLPPGFFEKRHVGDIVSRFGSIGTIQSTLTSLFVTTALDGIMALVSLSMMFLYSSTLSWITCAGIALYGLLRWGFYHPFRQAAHERLVLEARESSHFLESIRAIVPLKLFGREVERLARWQNLRRDVINRDVKTERLEIMFDTANAFISGARGLAVLYFGALAVIGNDLSLGMLTAFMSYAGTFSARAFGLVDRFVDLKMLGMHCERLADIVLEETEPQVLGVIDTSRIEPSICLVDVRFRYADGEPWVLDGVNLDVPAGQSVALTGASGCGKTTLCKIMLGLLEPTEGKVLVGGIDIRHVGLRHYRNMIGSVMQDDVLLAGSILENITFYDTGADLARVEVVARLAAIHDDIVRMPMGYQTPVGDMGSALSGGQRQRLFLARALYKQPRILALDEATSHLDIANENIVSAALAKLNMTRVIIAHRPETIRSAQRVIYLHGGTVRDWKESDESQALVA